MSVDVRKSMSRAGIWAGFVIMLVTMRYYSWVLQKSGYDIVAFEFAGELEGKRIIDAWTNGSVTGFPYDYIGAAFYSTLYDYLFILFYVLLLVMLSRMARRSAGHPFFDGLLRWNPGLAITAGAFDFIENALMLYNISGGATGGFFSAAFFAWVKFVLLGWCMLVLVVSWVGRLVKLGRLQKA